MERCRNDRTDLLLLLGHDSVTAEVLLTHGALKGSQETAAARPRSLFFIYLFFSFYKFNCFNSFDSYYLLSTISLGFNEISNLNLR